MRISETIKAEFGAIDIYLFDQIMKGRFDNRPAILDAGCGGGRNLIYFLRNGFDVWAVDRDPMAVDRIRTLAAELAPQLPNQHFWAGDIAELPFADRQFGVVMSNAVLHFAENEQRFERMIRAMWRVLVPGGMFFARLTSSIGLEGEVVALGDGRYRLPDGSDRFLVDERKLLAFTKELGGELLDPLKTTNVQNLRCMTTWCVRKIA